MISILIPNHKEERIHEVIEEIENLFISPCEIIIAYDRDSRGKGWAVREALKEAKGEEIIFLDGDMDIHPKMIKRLLPHLDEFDIVVGKKDARGIWSRYILTILSRIYIYLLFRIKVDTQTGIKIFRRSVLPEWKCDSFAFDIEILAKAQRAGASMFEVTVDAKVSRKMRFLSIWRTLKDTFKIRKEVYSNG